MNTTASANLFSRLFDNLGDPTRLAIEMLDGTRISYGDLIARAGPMANVLVARGVKPGDRVAAQTEKSVPALVLYLATVRAGAVYLPLNTAYTLNELEYLLTNAARQGSAGRRRAAVKTRIRHRRARQRRSGGDPLYLRHHGAIQGRDADA